jgi:BASS family bile acid:Na+ symporter
MEILKTLLPILIQTGIVSLVLGVGLDAGPEDALYLVRRPGQLAKAFVAIIVVAPVVAVLVTGILPLSLPARIGVIVMSAAAVPPFVPGSATRGGGRRAYVYGLYAAFALLTVVTVPVTVAALDKVYGSAAEAPLPKLIGMVLLTVLLPLAIGMAVRARWPAFAERVGPWISRVAMLLLLIILVLLVVRAWPAIVALVGNGTILAVVAISLAAIAAGHVLGGPDPRDQVALSTMAATRHPGIALMIAGSLTPDKSVSAMIVLYVLVSFVTVALYQAVLKRRSRAGSTASPRGGARA